VITGKDTRVFVIDVLAATMANVGRDRRNVP
jgi:hypothetical protein